MYKNLALRALTFMIAATPVLPAYADDVLKTEHGARLKLIVRHDSAVFAEPNEKSRSQPLRQFDFYFVLPADKSGAKTKNGFYRIATGTAESNEIGWIKQDDTVLWGHNQVLGFSKRGERDPASFFGSQQALETYLKDSSTKTAISQEPEGADILGLIPILGEKKITHNGEEIRSWEVGYLHSADPKNTTSRTSEKQLSVPQIQRELTLDIVFVVDTTSSMKAYITKTKEVVNKIASAINGNSKIAGRVRLGLVGFKDKNDSYTTKILCNLEAGANLQEFEKALGGVEAIGGGDTPEQVFAGCRTAITDMPWNSIANKHIILIGDSPNHEDEKSIVTLESVLAAAQPSASSSDLNALLNHITLHSLKVGEGDGPDHLICKNQFATLAAGRQFPGISANPKNLSTFAETLLETLTKQVKTTQIAINGDTETLEKNPFAGSLGAVLSYLGKEKVTAATFAKGYASEIDSKGNRCLEPFMLVARNDLRAFKSSLEFCITSLESGGSPGSKDVEKILASLQTLTAHVNFGDSIKANTPLREIFQLILGLPVKAKCFDMTISRLASMSQRDYDAWLKEIEASHAVLEIHLEKARWFNVGRESKPEARFAFIRITDLP